MNKLLSLEKLLFNFDSKTGAQKATDLIYQVDIKWNNLRPRKLKQFAFSMEISNLKPKFGSNEQLYVSVVIIGS